MIKIVNSGDILIFFIMFMVAISCFHFGKVSAINRIINMVETKLVLDKKSLIKEINNLLQ